MINFEIINSSELNEHINYLDASIAYIKSDFNIELKTYGNIIRIAINAIQEETIDNLIERVEINKELERALDNAGGYTIEYIVNNNPKVELIKMLQYLKKNQPKQKQLFKYLQNVTKKEFIVADTNDIDFIKQQNRNPRIKVLSFAELKRTEFKNRTLVFHSFNGQKDFEYIYNLKTDVALIIYEQENKLYQKQLAQRRNLIENEMKSDDRLKICGIAYSNPIDKPVDISTTIESIVNRLDDWGSRAYDGYKNECDILLNEIEEKIVYKILTDDSTFFLESNDSIFNNKGDLIKAYKIKVGDRIRIYPKEQLAENLYQVAVETEPEIFGKVEEHSLFWKQLINELRTKYGDDNLHKKLKNHGLRILLTTLETYGKGYRKFPMFNNDLRAILKLYYPLRKDSEIDTILNPILKSKTTYNSTMIVLGRGLKQELRLFLKENRIGEILQKRNFNNNTLKVFIEDFMPVHTVIKKEIFNDELEYLETETLFQQIEL